MSQESLKLLLVGDEMGSGALVQTEVQKLGHKVDWFLKSDEAALSLSQTQYDYILVDCMLPGAQNGVDFILSTQTHYSQSHTRYILMSAVFNEKLFVKEALEKTKAIAFIDKSHNFDVKKITSLLVKATPTSSKEMSQARKSLYQIFANEKVSSREKRRIIESLDEVSGYDLPFIYSLLVETKSSGYLNIYGKMSSSVSGITFSEGEIISVDIEDQTTYLGELLIQSGYALADDIQLILSEKTSSNQKIGARLIQANLISPHAFELMLSEQMNLRISRTITEHSVKINFANAEVEKTAPSINSEQLTSYLHDWIASKINMNWLMSLYAVWSGHQIVATPSLLANEQIFDLPLMRAVPQLKEKLNEKVSLNLLLDDKEINEAALYKALHFLLTKGYILFGARTSFRTEQEQLAAVKKVHRETSGKSQYEIIETYGLENIQNNEYLNLIGNKPSEKNKILFNLWSECKKQFDDCLKKGSEPNLKNKIKQDAASKEAENKLKAGQALDEIKQYLFLNQYVKAQQKIAEVLKLNFQSGQVHLFNAWIKLGLNESQKKNNHLKEVEYDLLQVPPEDRYDALYPFVVGLLQKQKGDLMGAKKQFEKSVGLNSGLLVARRELANVQNLLKKEGDIFSQVDLKSFVGGLFGKK